MLAVMGYGSSIVTELRKLIGDSDQVVRLDARWEVPGCGLYHLPNAERYLLTAGVIYSKEVTQQMARELVESVSVNLINVLRLCEMILSENADSRICIVGSESAKNGSFDRLYAACKAGIHAYVQQRPTRPLQQLVCVSPPIIADSAMTRRRHDYPQVLEQRPHCHAIDVARVIKRVLYDRRPDEINGCVIPIQATYAKKSQSE